MNVPPPGRGVPPSADAPAHPSSELVERIRVTAAALSDAYDEALACEKRLSRTQDFLIDALSAENERLEHENELLRAALRQAA